MVDKSLLQFDEIVLLAGRSIKSSDKVISRRNDYISARGCKGIGYMLQRLKEAVKEGRKYRCSFSDFKLYLFRELKSKIEF